MTDTLTPLRPEVWLTHKGFVKKLARALVADPDSAEDLVQETWLAALRKPPKHSEAVLTWLSRVTRNAAYKVHRREGRRAVHEQRSARPEALESTETIVLRLAFQREITDAVLQLSDPYREAIILRYFEDLSPTAIAHKLAVPVATVRARLFRGRKRLRAQLDQAHVGDRGTWLTGLVAFSGLNPDALAISGISAGALTTGGVVVGSKIAIVGALALLVGGLLYVLLPSGEESITENRGRGELWSDSGSSEVPPSEHSSETLEMALVESTDPDLVSLSLEENSEAAQATPADPLAAPPVLEAGKVSYQVVDGVTREPIGAKIRFLSEERYAEDKTSAEKMKETLLSPGSYEASVTSKGHEVFYLDEFQVLAGELTDLGVIALEPGSARIEGEILASHFDQETPLSVHLFGDGRRPCKRCFVPQTEGEIKKAADLTGDPQEDLGWEREESCSACGYTKKKTIVTARVGEGFAFPDLAAGTYFLRVFEATCLPVGKVKKVVLNPREWTRMDLVLNEAATLEVELMDEAGVAFPGEDDLQGAWAFSGLKFSFGRNGVDLVQAKADLSGRMSKTSRSDMLTRLKQEMNGQILMDQALALNHVQQVSDFRFAFNDVRGIRGLEFHPRTKDRRRESGDSLHPGSFKRPEFSTSTVQAVSIGGGVFRIHPLPRKILQANAVFGGMVSHSQDVDLRSGFERVRMTMDRSRARAALALSDTQRLFQNNFGVLENELGLSASAFAGVRTRLLDSGGGVADLMVLSNAAGNGESGVFSSGGNVSYTVSFSGAVGEDGGLLMGPQVLVHRSETIDLDLLGEQGVEELEIVVDLTEEEEEKEE